MSRISVLLKEMGEEAVTSRNMLSRVPEDKFGWQPHPKSMTLGRLSAHVAELPAWVAMTLTTSEMDLAKNTDYKARVPKTHEELMSYFEEQLTFGEAQLTGAKESELDKDWSFLNAGKLISVRTKAEVIRMAFCQIVHHRAQLGVFLRLLDVPIPGSYGPSADEAF
jgi:uncharacterized damage-inducible protein DinB